MRRREFIAGLCGAAAALSASARAQESATRSKPFRIVTLPDFLPSWRDAFLVAMGDLGWREGRDFLVEQSGAEVGDTIFNQAAQSVVASVPDLIVVPSTA